MLVPHHPSRIALFLNFPPLISSFLIILCFSNPSKAVPWDQEIINYNYVISAHAIDGKYKFTTDHPDVEAAKKLLELGANTIKIRETEGTAFEQIMDLPFKTVFIWIGNRTVWKNYDTEIFTDGLTEEEATFVYQEMYQYARSLLLRYSGTKKTIFLGQWEGDWEMLMPQIDSRKNAPEAAIQGAILWLNTRQAALEAAKRDTPHQDITLWHYAEVNRVRDAMDLGKARMVNRVLPNIDTDFISYSSYDIQGLPQDQINGTLDYIRSKMRPKPSIPTEDRLLIGEFAFRAKAFEYDSLKHEAKNRETIVKFLRYGVPQILYWNMYDNEYSNGIYQGFWLIDQNNQKYALYHTIETFFLNAKTYVAGFRQNEKRMPTLREYTLWAAQFLESYRP